MSKIDLFFKAHYTQKHTSYTYLHVRYLLYTYIYNL